MRITGGAWVSRHVAGPGRGKTLRPTPDALREQAFAVLAPELGGAVFLDLFAGTGVNSLEALSRGAASAVLIDCAPASVALMRRNFAALGVAPDHFEILAKEIRRALPGLAAHGLEATVAWCDPPFAAWEEGPAALALACEVGVLRTGAGVVLEAPPKVTPEVPGFEVVRALHGAFLLRVGVCGPR